MHSSPVPGAGPASPRSSLRETRSILDRFESFPNRSRRSSQSILSQSDGNLSSRRSTNSDDLMNNANAADDLGEDLGKRPSWIGSLRTMLFARGGMNGLVTK